MNDIGYVYLLIHPQNDDIRYVGATKNPQQRYQQHKSDRCHKEMRNWFRKLESDGLTPKMSIVAVAPIDELAHFEKKWIQMLDGDYELLNRNKNISYNHKKVKKYV